MPDPVKRLRYFDGELLRAADLKAEQDYHVGLRRGQNRALWVAGIGDGLSVVAGSGATVVVKSGRAIDGQGRDLVLANDSAPVDLSGVAVGSSVYVTLGYDEQETNPSTPPSTKGNTRVTEQPVIKTPGGLPPDQLNELVLGRATRTATGVTLDASAPRRTLEPRALDALRKEIASKLPTSGGTIATLSVSGTLGVTGKASLGNLSVTGTLGATGPATLADVSISGKLGATGDTTLKNLSVTGSLGASGQTTLKNLSAETLGVPGRSTLGNLSVSGPLEVIGKTTLRDVEITGDTALRSLRVNGPATFDDVVDARHVRVARLSSGTTDPRRRIHFDQDEVYSRRGFSFGDAQVPGFTEAPANGERWEWFANSGEANLWSGDYMMWIDARGNLTVPGTVKGSVKQFSIAHPLDPDNRMLEHATLEGPEVGVYYRGESRLEDGYAEIELPDYFEALTRQEERSVLITPKHEPDADSIATLAASEVADGRFTVVASEGGNAGQPFYWEVKAVRSDTDSLEVEPDKVARPVKPTEDD